MKYIFAFLFALLSAACVFCQTVVSLSKTVRDNITVPKFKTSPVIDGRLDDEVWKQAAVLRDLIQTSPADNVAASKPTEVYLGYDEKNFYVAFKCWDEKEKIRASVVCAVLAGRVPTWRRSTNNIAAADGYGRYEGVIRTAIVEKKKLKGESNDQKTANVNL